MISKESVKKSVLAFFPYLLSNKVMALAGAYFLFSALLNAFTGIDICFPCLWKTFFGLTCPSCGLTTAFMELVRLDFRKAFETNWLILFVVPGILYFLLQDYMRFVRKHQVQAEPLP